MHYRNGREAKNGDKIVFLGYDGGKLSAFGVLMTPFPATTSATATSHQSRTRKPALAFAIACMSMTWPNSSSKPDWTSDRPASEAAMPRFPLSHNTSYINLRSETMPTATVSAEAQAGRRKLLRDKRRNRAQVWAALRNAASAGTFPKLGFGQYFTVADAVTDAGVEADDPTLDAFIGDCCEGGDGTGFQAFEDAVGAKLAPNGGPFIDLITQLLPILLPLLIGCIP